MQHLISMASPAKAVCMLVMDGRINNVEGFSDGLDIWNIAVKYSNGPLFAALSYIALNGDSNVFVNSTTTADLNLDHGPSA